MERIFNISAKDSMTERARTITEVALGGLSDNDTKAAMINEAAFAVAQVLERYQALDAVYDAEPMKFNTQGTEHLVYESKEGA